MVGFLIALVAAVLAAVFWFQAQSASSAVAGLKAESDAARKEAEELRAQLRDAQAESKARSQQILDLREKLNDARKRTQQSPQKQRSAREAELEEDLSHARRLLEEAHAAEQNARKDAAGGIAEAAHLRAELERAQARNREMAAAPPPPPVPVAAAAPAVDDSRLKDSESRRAEAERRAREFEVALKDAREKERAAREEVRRARGRAETNNRVYLVTKGELEVIRERFALAEKALWKAGLPVPTTPQRERPVATGPAAAPAAQRAAESASADGPVPRAESTPAEPPSGGVEPISAAAAQMPGEASAVRNGAEGEGEPAHS
jgi:chromosome segregation ATPase